MLKHLSRFLGYLIAAYLSPTKPLLKWALSGYFNFEAAIQSPQAMMAEYQHFNLTVANHPNEILFHLIPQLLIIMGISLLLTLGIGHLINLLVTQGAEKWKHRFRWASSQQ